MVSGRTSYSQALATFDPAAILASLSGEVTISVAVHDEPLQGKETASFLFGVLTQELAPFELTEEIVEGDKSAVLFETSLRGHRAHGLNVVTLSGGDDVLGRAVILASGVEYRRLGVPSLDRWTGAGLFYGATGAAGSALAGERVCVVGGANSAGQAALHLSQFASHVTLIVRGPALEAGMSDYLVRQIQVTSNIDVRLRSRIVDGHGTGRLAALELENGEGRHETIPATALFVMIGAEARTDWLGQSIRRDDHGFVLTGRDLPPDAWATDRPPLPFETSMPGVFAVGDVRHGSIKRVAEAVGEGSVAVGSVHQHLARSQPSADRG